mgnify:CR=1 FL=1|jgi:hypothetical protein|tara:strand:+ start:9 stop:554 length:546 start_codon:yes stop_codon:yes gene_type:complete
MTLIKTRARGLKLDDTFAFTGTVSGTGGIAMLDQWRTTGGQTHNVDPVQSLERVDTDGFSGIGTGMSQASGIFTFPQTGIYHIIANFGWYRNQNDRLIQGQIITTTDNSSYSEAATCYGHTVNGLGDSVYSSGSCSFIFDVTSTSTHKVKFGSFAQDSATVLVGNTNASRTHFTFIRFGDT